MLELLSPAGSAEAVVAAVQNGADAVYVGFGSFNARLNAKNLTPDELAQAVGYCHVRGVKLYVTINTLVTDRELPAAADLVRQANRAGADAILVQDLGLLRVAKQVAPQLPVHASTQMSVHNLEGVNFAASCGISRVVLARELTKQQIAYICRHSPIEIEVFAHGALCMSYSGQCYMSAVIGRRSGNRGLCAQPCRLPYGYGNKADGYPLSLKDLCLAQHLEELSAMGVASIKIEGRMKRPEYTAIVTKIYSSLIKENRKPTSEELELLEAAFSREGFTDGYYENAKGAAMFGVREENTDEPSRIFAEARNGYQNGQSQRVPVRFYALIRKNEPAMLAVEDDKGRICKTEGRMPEPAFHAELIEAQIKTQLYKTGGTPYYCTGVKAYVEKGLSLPLAAINAMRREVLDKLSAERAEIPAREEGQFHAGPQYINRSEKPDFTVSLMRADQLSGDLVSLSPKLIYLPLAEALREPERIAPVIGSSDIEIAVSLPRIIGDHEAAGISKQLDAAYSLGIRQALIGNIGHIELARSRGFALRGDFGLNICNSQTLREFKRAGLLSAALSFELNFAQIRDISKNIDTEVIVYGRLPLMIMGNCVIKNKTGMCACENLNQLTDRTGAIFPLVKDTGCRNVLLNSQKIFLADKEEDYQKLGLWGARLMFTTENSRECFQVLERYMNLGKYQPNGFTRGLYYRGVE